MQEIKKEGTYGEGTLAKIFEGTPYAGTGTKEEKVELEKVMREMLQLKIYPYSYIEKFLLDKGYRLDSIRKIFYDITGVKIESLLEQGLNNKIFNTPTSIPQFNLGWGTSKNKKFDYYFIMPYLYGYAIFGQKGEHIREMVKVYDSKDLETARMDLSKMVGGSPEDKIYKIKQDKIEPMWYNGIMDPKYSQVKEIKSYLNFCGNAIDKKKYIQELYYSGGISKEDYIQLSEFIKKAGEAIEEKAKSPNLEEYNVNKELSEVSPSDFFENAEDNKSIKFAEAINGIQEYIFKKQQELKDKYTITINSLKYKASKSIDYLERAVEKEEKKSFEILRSNGVVAVILEFSELKSTNIKYGLMVFSIVDNELQTSGDFKGEDNKIYSLSEEGLAMYFSTKEEK